MERNCFHAGLPLRPSLSLRPTNDQRPVTRFFSTIRYTPSLTSRISPRSHLTSLSFSTCPSLWQDRPRSRPPSSLWPTTTSPSAPPHPRPSLRHFILRPARETLSLFRDGASWPVYSAERGSHHLPLPPLSPYSDGKLTVLNATTILSPSQEGPLRRSKRPMLKLLEVEEVVLVHPRPRGGQQGDKRAQGASLRPQFARHRRSSRRCCRQGHQGQHSPVVPSTPSLQGGQVQERGTFRICFRPLTRRRRNHLEPC
jgi:hypothetical protein